MFQKNEFKAELVRRGLSVEQVAKMLGIDTVSLYRKMNGESDFFRNEIDVLRRKLNLSDADLLKIFFAKELTFS